MSIKPIPDDIEPVVTPAGGETAPDLGGPGADLGTHAGTGADSGGTGAGTTALDAIGSQSKFDSGVADHMKIKHKI